MLTYRDAELLRGSQTLSTFPTVLHAYLHGYRAAPGLIDPHVPILAHSGQLLPIWTPGQAENLETDKGIRGGLSLLTWLAPAAAAVLPGPDGPAASGAQSQPEGPRCEWLGRRKRKPVCQQPGGGNAESRSFLCGLEMTRK